MDVLIEHSSILLSEGQEIYLNGTFDNGSIHMIKKISKSTMNVKLTGEWNLKVTESDTKIFFMLAKLGLQVTKVLIFSLDADVKILAICWASKLPHLEIVVKSSASTKESMFSNYFLPSKFVNYMRTNFTNTENLQDHSLSLLRTFVLFGSDFTPGFVKISHSFALHVWDEMMRKKLLKDRADYFLLILKVYGAKNKGLMRLLSKNEEDLSLKQRYMETRTLLKCKNGVESLSIPLESVLHLQIQRSEYIAATLLDDKLSLDPLSYGWELDPSNPNLYNIRLQNVKDPYYTLPRSLLEGCSCRKDCKIKKCKCKKDEGRANKCSRLTCKFCPCFKRQKDSDSENLILSDQFQDILNQMSSSDESSGSEDEISYEFDSDIDIDEILYNDETL